MAINRIRFEDTTDWSAAFDNRAAVGATEVQAFINDITARAAVFRSEMMTAGRAEIDLAYGDQERQRFDLFTPEKPQKGLAIFVHGGYWRSFDKSAWSHLAVGAIKHDFAVAIPSYTLCPEVKISQITAEIATFAADVAGKIDDGPIHLIGHSAGGHLVTRLASGALDRRLLERVAKIVSVSGVHDLRPLLKTSMNDDLRLDLAEARSESPLLLEPVLPVDLTCWVGGDELPSFRRQNRQLTEAWAGLGMTTEAVEAEGKNHFSVIDDLSDPESELVKTLLG